MKWTGFLCVAMVLCVTGFTQSRRQVIYDSINTIENIGSLTGAQKLSFLYRWQKELDATHLKDSVNARIYHKVGLHEFLTNRNYAIAIHSTTQAAAINSSGEKGTSRRASLASFYNLGYYYDHLSLFNEAVKYYDTSIELSEKFGSHDVLYDARLSKSYIYFRTGDYQKSVEESVIGMRVAFTAKDSSYYPQFLNQRAQSLFFQNDLQQSLDDANAALTFGALNRQPYQLASAYKMKAYIYAKKRDFPNAASFFKKSIEQRLLTQDNGQIAGDLNDFGNFYRDSVSDYSRASEYFQKGMSYALKANDSVRLSRIQVNLAETNGKRDRYTDALIGYQNAFRYLRILGLNDPLLTPSATKLNTISNKELVMALISGKVNLLLLIYKKTPDKKYLQACLQTAHIADSVITQTRHEQSGEQSKLYWRDRTRSFFSNAIEACYLANDIPAAFYFMEKSRAVLLNDKLNELGAHAHLPPNETLKEQDLRINILEEQQKLNELNEKSEAYKDQQAKLFQAKENFEQYIKSLEQKYPVYYQYKYADDVPSLKDLQQYVAANQESFVHYFMNDSAIYMLTVTPTNSWLTKVAAKNIQANEITSFLQLCSDEQLMNANAAQFSNLSYALYTKLFQPLKITAGRIVICPDNFILPFEAFCSDKAGKHFLAYDYVFSYVYSAGYLLKKFNPYPSKGNFIGFAPVSFKSYLQVPDLKQSVVSLEDAAGQYGRTVLFTNSKATKRNFIKRIPEYDIVSVFSHAYADTSGNEPVLYMQDSMIHLSELQLLDHSAIRLMVLSACETNVGKKATGEGIYSLARGFAAAGIPSVAATMWKADEDAMYAISQNFHKYLSMGMRKDDALQKAKLDFIKEGRKNSMPYFWANMIVIGNTEAIDVNSYSHNYLWIVIPAAVICIILIVIWARKIPSRLKTTLGSA